MLREDTTLWASDTSQEAVTEAREWIKDKGLTQEDVRLIRDNKTGMTLVVAKRRVEV